MLRKLRAALRMLGAILVLVIGIFALGSPQTEKQSTSEQQFRFKIPADTSPFSILLMILTGTFATAAILLLAAYAWNERAFEVFAVGALMALAVTGIASVVGFLFGLPRYSDSPGPDGLSIAAEARAAGLYVPSNNLEQVSDWLTKLLLGAGLVQLGRVGRWLGGFIDGVAGAFTTDSTITSTARVLAASLLAFYSAFGFLFGYIVTSIWYRRRLQETTRHVLEEIHHRERS
jgi:hypothetical protein